MDSTPNEDSFNFLTVLLSAFKIISKNLLGLLSITFGVVTRVYIIRKGIKRISKWQCRLSVFISIIAGMIAYLLVQDLDIKSVQKGIIVSCTPVFIEPIIMRLLLWVNPLIDDFILYFSLLKI